MIIIYGHDFHEMHTCLRGSNNLVTMLTLIITDLPSSADKIVEPRPDVNIEVVAYTVTE